MSTITIETPSKTIRIKRADCIGRFYIIYSPEFNERLLANCIDAFPEGTPKRMRVQRHMSHGGKVIQPHQYEILEENPQWED